MERHCSARCQHCDGMGQVTSVDSEGSQAAIEGEDSVTGISWPVRSRTMECRDCGERWIKS